MVDVSEHSFEEAIERVVGAHGPDAYPGDSGSTRGSVRRSWVPSRKPGHQTHRISAFYTQRHESPESLSSREACPRRYESGSGNLELPQTTRSDGTQARGRMRLIVLGT